MRPYHDSPLDLAARWYWVDPANPVIPYQHAFASHVHDRDEEPEPPIGERYAFRPWDGGQPPFPAPGLGLCGDADAWSRGVSVDALHPLMWPLSNIPRCCGAPDEVGRGGVEWGGRGIEPPFNPCLLPPLPFASVVLSLTNGTCPDSGGLIQLATVNDYPPCLDPFPPIWSSLPFNLNGEMVRCYVGGDVDSGMFYFAMTDQDDALELKFTLPDGFVCAPTKQARRDAFELNAFDCLWITSSVGFIEHI